MEQIKRAFVITLSSLLLFAAAVLALFLPVLSFGQTQPNQEFNNVVSGAQHNEEIKKTVFIVADGKLTEMFDMLAPFYIFNATQKMNVYIVAKDPTPIRIKRDLYVEPQMTFAEVEAKKLSADVIVIPALSARDKNQDPAIINFIKTHFLRKTKLITICDGASTGAATGLYDGKPLTAHATDYDCIKKYWSGPVWTQNLTFTKHGNLYSTAGVANAVEGSLQIVEDLFGRETRLLVADDINYPHAEIPVVHSSKALSLGNKLTILNRMTIGKRRKLGLLLHDGFNELKFASIVDTYSRTYPREFKTFSSKGSIITSKHGLKFIRSNDNTIDFKIDEVLVIMPEAIQQSDEKFFKNIPLVGQNDTEYPIDQCISRISEQFGEHYGYVVKLTLDYN